MASLSRPMPNLTLVRIGAVLVAFSYETPIAYLGASYEWVIRENKWSNATGKHMAYLDHGDERGSGFDRPAIRFADQEWENMFAKYVRRMTNSRSGGDS